MAVNPDTTDRGLVTMQAASYVRELKRLNPKMGEDEVMQMVKNKFPNAEHGLLTETYRIIEADHVRKDKEAKKL